MAGLVVLAGGAEFDGRMAIADRAWLAALPGRPRLLVLPTANQDRPDLAAANGVRHFRGLGAEVEALMVTNADRANDPELLRDLENADCLYMAGGNPRYLYSVLYESLAWQSISRRWQEGMALCGSSAGAMVLCQAIYLGDTWTDAIGLIPDAVCMPHFNNRESAAVEKARAAVTARGLLGLGIDESTALYWSEGVWRVEGAGRVSVLSGAGIKTLAAGEVVAGLPQPALPEDEGRV
jgi:cyanophycinase